MKVRKILLSIVLAIIAIILVFNSKAYATTGSWKLSAVHLREGITTRKGKEVQEEQ